MEKRDLIVIVVAVVIVLIMAMYIKPLVTGKPVQLIPEELSGLFGGKNQTLENNSSFSNQTSNLTRDTPVISSILPANLSADQVEKTIIIEGRNLSESLNVSFINNGEIRTYPATFINGTLSISDVSLPEGNWTMQMQDAEKGLVFNSSFIINVTPKVTPVPTWNGSPVDVGLQNGSSGAYIYPRNYPVNSNPRYSFNQELTPLMTYTKFSGQYSAKTNTFYIPTGYWELWYTVEVSEDLHNPSITKKVEATETTSEGRKVIPETTDSISVVNPQFSIQVNKGDDGAEIRMITPTGGLNPRIWSGDFVSPNYDEEKPTDLKPAPDETISNANWDPRPWKEKFYEGYQTYNLNIYSYNIISYSIEIKVPDIKSSTTSNNTTQSGSIPSISPGTLMESTLNTYIESIKGNLSDSATFEKIIGTVSQNVLYQKSRDGIFVDLNNMKNSQIMITGFKKIDVFYRGPEGSLKGDLTYQTKTGERTLPVDIPFIQQNDGWKINDLPLIRI